MVEAVALKSSNSIWTHFKNYGFYEYAKFWEILRKIDILSITAYLSSNLTNRFAQM